MFENIKTTPQEIFSEYRAGVDYKSSMGDKGLYEQTKLNERFYVGDQWYGVSAGNSRPLVRRNIIKRIGEYKLSAIGAVPIAVNYSADGIPDTHDLSAAENVKCDIESDGLETRAEVTIPDAVEISVVMNQLSNYFSVTAERLRLKGLCEMILRNAYISGTGFLYTYWDPTVETGLYADRKATCAIRGDIISEVLDVENVNLGEPNNFDMQSQPFIIISQRKTLGEVKRMATLYHQKSDDIKPDDAAALNLNSGDRGESEPDDSQRVTVLTKFWKEYDKSGKVARLMGITVTENAVIRPQWDLKVKMYPLAKFCWERRRSCGYGDSEITYLIPNQIAINRALTAAVWATMNAGMPKILVNGDIVGNAITNDPGQVITVNGGDGDVRNAVHYLQPPAFAEQFEALVNDMAVNTMSDCGANDAALGNLRPDNASAIIQVREAALQPMQMYQNRYYDFVEDVARIWADFWLNLYGDRSLKIKDEKGVYYVPFSADRYKNLIINANIDVGASALWSESVVIASLDGLLKAGLITFRQYLERVPKGLIPNIEGLLESIRNKEAKESLGDDGAEKGDTLADGGNGVDIKLPDAITNSMEATK